MAPMARPLARMARMARWLAWLSGSHIGKTRETNQFYLAGWEVSCVSCWEKGTDNVFPATLKNT